VPTVRTVQGGPFLVSKLQEKGLYVSVIRTCVREAHAYSNTWRPTFLEEGKAMSRSS
jgi:hypothetical protein